MCVGVCVCMCMCVCVHVHVDVHVFVCVSVLQDLGCSREGISGQICVKFGKPIAWVSPCFCFFPVFENFHFRPQDQILDHKWTENLCGTLGKAQIVKSV